MRSVQAFNNSGRSPYRYFSDVHYSVLEARQKVTEDVNRVVADLEATRQEFQELLSQGEFVLQTVSELETQCPKDDSKRLVTNYLQAEDLLIDLASILASCENNAVCDPELDGKNEQRVTRAFRRLIGLVQRVAEVTRDIRWGIMESTEGVDVIVSEETPEELLARL